MKPSERTLSHAGAKVIRRGAFVVTWSDAKGEHTAPIAHKMTVGSAKEAGLVVDEPTVSRVHAELLPTSDGLWVRDLGSRNGTYVDRVRVKEALWPNGGKLHLGAAECVLGDRPVPVPYEVWPEESFGPLVGRSPSMRELFATLAHIAKTSSSVLIHGETGTGKELVALALHEASPRSAAPFGIVDCASISESLFESELFGHVKGAFTGALETRTGAIESAEGGTLFLDEVGELPLGMQAKLLRFLESRTVRRVGQTAYRSVDVRVLAATHRDLLSMVNSGEFREDLYFRLAVVPIDVPPLRDRREDIPLLTSRFLATLGATSFPTEVDEKIAAHAWRGNVRELRNFVERAVALGPERAFALAPAGGVSAHPATAPETSGDYDLPFKAFRETWIEQGERAYLSRLIAKHDGDMTAAVRAAEVDRTYLFRLKKKYGL